MRRRLPVASCVLLVVLGCGAPAPLQPGDVVRPQLALAPEEPWPAGGRVAIGMLVEVHRPGQSGPLFLREGQVGRDEPDMGGRLTFFAGDTPLGDPLELTFVRDC